MKYQHTQKEKLKKIFKNLLDLSIYLSRLAIIWKKNTKIMQEILEIFF